MRLLFLQQWFSDEVIQAIGWTFIHSLWQGLLAAVLAGIIIMMTKKSAAVIRYNLLVTLLVVFIVATGITFSQQLRTNVVTETAVANPVIQVADNSFISDTYKEVPVVSKTSLEKFINYFNTNADLFVFIWAIFFLFHCIKLLTGLAGINRLRSYKTYHPGKEWQEKVTGLSNNLGIRRAVVLLESKLVKMPVAVGYLKPIIFVPFGLLSNLPPEQVETILLHELAHIRRSDYLVNILQRVTEAVYFFNPAYLWISSMIRHEREACCDDIVLANSHHKQSYLEALVSFQEYSFANSGYMMAISGKKNYLLNRVKRMITRENKKLDIMEKIFLLTGVIVISAFTFIPKNEPVDKKNVTVVPVVNESIKQKPAKIVSASHVERKRKPVAKMAVKVEPVLEIYQETPKKDTLPKEKNNYSDLRFPGISSTVNDDGKTKTENTTVTDKDGKKYTYSKVNDKVTSLTVDGKAIPESEIKNYSGLFESIEAAKQERTERKLKALQERKMENDKRREDVKIKIAERNLEKELKKKINQQVAEHEKEQARHERAMKNLENKQKALNKQKDDLNKQQEKLNRKLKQAPGINGREVIKNDVHVENSITASVNTNTNVDIKTDNDKAGSSKKTMNLKSESLKFNNDKLFFDVKDLKQKINVSTGIQKDILKNLDFKFNTKETGIYYQPEYFRTKPAAHGERAQETKPRVQPDSPQKSFPTPPKKKGVTT